MKYNIYIQDILIGSIEADNTGDALKVVGSRIDSNEIIFDPSKKRSIRIEPDSTNE